MAATCDERFWPASAPRPGGGPEAIDVNGWWKATCDFRSAARIVDLQRVGYKNAKKRHCLETAVAAAAEVDKSAALAIPSATSRERAFPARTVPRAGFPDVVKSVRGLSNQQLAL